MVHEEDLLGNYHWELIEMGAIAPNETDIINMKGIGQQGRLIMTVESILTNFLNDKCKYDNGSLYINE